MTNWRDALTQNFEVDEDTGGLISAGHLLTDEAGITPYGKMFFEAEFKKLNTAIEAALDEIAYLKTFVPNERIDQPTLELMRAKADRDYAALVEYKTETEQYVARRMSVDDIHA